MKHEVNKKADNVKKYEDAVSIVRAYEEIIKIRKKNTIHNFLPKGKVISLKGLSKKKTSLK